MTTATSTSRQAAMMPASRSMLVPGAARSSSSSSSTYAGSTPLPVDRARRPCSPTARTRLPPATWPAARPGAACRLAVLGVGREQRTLRRGLELRWRGGLSVWWRSQVTSSVSSWKIGIPAWVGQPVRPRGLGRGLAVGSAGRSGSGCSGSGSRDCLADRRVRHGRQHDRSLAATGVLDPGQPGLGGAGRGAEEVAERVGQHRRGDLGVAAVVQHVVAHGVEGAGDAGAHLAWPQHVAVRRRAPKAPSRSGRPPTCRSSRRTAGRPGRRCRWRCAPRGGRAARRRRRSRSAGPSRRWRSGRSRGPGGRAPPRPRGRGRGCRRPRRRPRPPPSARAARHRPAGCRGWCPSPTR